MMHKKTKYIDSLMNDISEAESKDSAGTGESSLETLENAPYASESVEEHGRINFDKFNAVDLRVAKIIGVEKHPGTRKAMYKLTVDLGPLGIRTIVAGIADFYGRDELLGKKIIVVANLAPREIAGIVSDGMLLAAEDELNIALIVPDKDAAPGSRIH